MAAIEVYKDYPFIDSDQRLFCGFPDAIKQLTDEKYDRLTEKGLQPREYSTRRIRKVVASIALVEQTPSLTKICLVALGAGSRMIAPEELSKDGKKVFDCHAEILARRCLLRFLYAQLNVLMENGKDKSIFEHDSTSHQKFILKENLSFHLYISRPPCGDASIFGQQVDYHPERESRGIARAICSGKQGALKVPIGHPSIDDLKLKKIDHYTMCCSAKIAKWNVAGIQGAILSLLIPQPIYLKSITIGRRFNKQHLERAVYGRVSGIITVTVHKPEIHQLRNPECTTEVVKNSHKISLNWWVGNDQTYELIECRYGTVAVSKKTSKLAKVSLFTQFNDLAAKLNWIHSIQYDKAKSSASNYQRAKKEVFTQMNQGGSRWIQKPHEVDMFPPT